MGKWDDKFEKAEKKWASWSMQEYAQEDRVLTDIIADKARLKPDHVVFQFRDYPVTFAQLNERINRAANGFLALGVQKGDKVAIMLPNCPEFLYTWFGLNKIGAVEVPINVALKGAGLVHQIVQSDSIVLVADTQYLDRLNNVSDELTSVNSVVFFNKGADETLPVWSECTTSEFAALMDHSDVAPEADVKFSDMASILYTSGTTGVSKGVMISHHYWYEIWSRAMRTL